MKQIIQYAILLSKWVWYQLECMLTSWHNCLNSVQLQTQPES